MKLFPFGIMKMFPADYLAKVIIPFVLKDLEKFASNNTNWCNRKKNR